MKKKVDEKATVIIKYFSIKTDKPDESVDGLEQLCKKFDRPSADQGTLPILFCPKRHTVTNENNYFSSCA
jgi:hypothetical protein